MFIDHPVLQGDTIQFRGYQVNLARVAGQKNTLVVLPTGMGKTIVALLAVADGLKDGAKRVLLMAPTKPLVEQHARFLQDVLQAPWKDQVHCLTGNVPPGKRAKAYEAEGIITATPQVIANDLVGGRLKLDGFDWIVFDEAHRATGEYPYTFIGEEARKRNPEGHRMGLTASPGHDTRRIDDVRQALGLGHVEIRTPADPDVREYVQDVGIEWETLPMPANMARVSKRLNDALADRVRALKKMDLLKGVKKRPNRMELLEIGKKVQVRLKAQADPPAELYQALSVQAQAMKLLHAIELAETQGSEPFREFIGRLRKEVEGPKSSKASRMVVQDPAVVEAYQIAEHHMMENPKLGRIESLIGEQVEGDPDARVILFAHYRDTCEQVAQRLERIDGVRPVVFVGQGKRGGRGGLTQKQQAEIIEAFRQGEHNVLVATSVAEEGLDIPQTDLVVFYEPIGSEIRSIQRRGRTGRNRAGRVVVLMTKGTQDEAAHWNARRKEQQMIKELQDLRRVLERGEAMARAQRQSTLAAEPPSPEPLPSLEPPGDGGAATQDEPPGPPPGDTRSAPPPPAPTQSADDATGPMTGQNGPLIVCDHREQTGGVVRRVHRLGARVETRQLEVADFVLSDRVAVERKECADFVDSLVDGRLFEQVRGLQAYQKPFLIVEGESLYGHRSVSPEALQGALASITIDYGVPVMQTRDADETARFLVAVAKREQGRNKRKVAVRPGKGSMGDPERLRHILAGFPGIDGTLAGRLLDHFGTLRAVLDAPEAALSQVDGIGPKTAREMQRLLETAHRREVGRDRTQTVA